MPKRPRVTQKEIIEIQRLIATGESDEGICQKVNRHRSTVTRIRNGTKRKSVTTGGKMLQVRLTEEEHKSFKAKIEGQGLTMSDAGRRLVRHSLGLLDMRSEEIEALAALRKELNAIGVNLNQLTTLANSGRLSWNERDGKLVSSLDIKVDETVNQLVAFVTAGRQRSYVAAEFPVKGMMDE